MKILRLIWERGGKDRLNISGIQYNLIEGGKKNRIGGKFLINFLGVLILRVGVDLKINYQ